jgi:dTDP-4-amino-4,6-dideoxygalactose transaminase
VAASQVSILGPEVDALEKELADYLQVRYAIGVSSGTDALIMAFMSLGIGPGDEVIVPTFSFFATAGCVSRLGATPVFVDVDPISFNIDPALVRAAVTPKTKAIVPVHLFGQSADMPALMAIAAETGIAIVEDAAQAIGTQWSDGQRVGGMGLMGCFSFYPTKNLGALGDAGLITTNDSKLATHLKQLRNHGMEPRYYHSFIGGNFRLDAIQAAVLRVKLPHLPAWHEARRSNAAMYESLFIEAGLSESTGVTYFDGDNRVLLPRAIYEASGAQDHHIFNQYTIRVEKRDELRAFLQSRGIGSEIYYPVPFHRQACFASLNAPDSAFPVSNALVESVLALPIFPELSEEQIREVVVTVREFIHT